MKKGVVMKKNVFIRILFVFLAFFGLVIESFAGTKNVEFASVNFVGKLLENNTLSVVQSLDVNFKEEANEFLLPVPAVVRYRDKDDVVRKYVLRVEDVSVKDFDCSFEKSSSSNVNVKIVAADSVFSGKKKFTVSYNVVFPEDRLNEYDFFYYVLLDSEIGGEVKKFDFRIDFEKKIENLSEVSVFSGEKNERTNKLNVDVSFSKSGISGSALNIKNENAISVFMSLPEGYFVGSRRNLHLNVFAYIAFVAACALLVVLIVLILLVKNEKLESAPLAYPPEGISSAEVGFIIDSSADIDDIISLVPYWEAKGIVKIEEKDGGAKVVIKKNADLPENAPSHEKKFFNAIFADSIEFDLSSSGEKLSKGIKSSQNSLKSSFKGEKSLFRDRGTIPFCFAASMLLMLFLKFNSRVEFFGGFGYFAAPVMFLCGMLVALGKKRLVFKKNAFVLSRLITIAAAAALYAVTIFFTNDSDIVISKPLVAIPFALVAFIDILISRLREPTQYNREISAKLLGLKSFIASASCGDEKISEISASDGGYFKKILPYAFVFGLSEKWAAAFDNAEEGKTDASDYLKFFQSKVCDPIYKMYSKIYSRR